jgi:hypothetical protein
MRLLITNGDCTTDGLQHAGVPGEFLVWRDVLHDGPVPAGLSPEALAEVRARYIASPGWGAYEDILADLRQRNARVQRARDFDDVVLWFEHDLYDQLQLIEVLDQLAGVDLGRARLHLLCIDRHPEVPDFRGLGQLTPAQRAALDGQEAPVTPAQLDLARRAWAAFRAPDPGALVALAHADDLPLPFLAAALRSLLQLYPDVRDGLPRLEREILALASRGPCTLAALFRAHQATPTDDVFFVGDASFLWRALELCAGPAPLLRALDGAPPAPGDGAPPAPGDAAWQRAVELTDLGRAVLAGGVDVAGQRGYDRWIGGVHLASGQGAPAWRWDPGARTLRSAP